MSEIIMYNGDTRIFHGTVLNGTTAYDLRGMYVMFTVKRKVTDSDEEALIAKDIGPLTGTAAEAGQFSITLDSTDTQNLAAGNYVYDFQLVDVTQSPHVVTTLGAGTFTIVAGVTTRTTPRER